MPARSPHVGRTGAADCSRGRVSGRSVPFRWPEVRNMVVNDLPVAISLLEHQRNRLSPRAELLRDLRGSRRWENRGRVAEEACDGHRPVAIQLDEPIAIFGKRLHAAKSLRELVERSL